MRATALLILPCLAWLAPALAQEGSAEAGRAKSAVCAACHGADGNSVNPEWPSLAGQHPRYIVAQLEAFQAGTRSNPLMTPMAQPLTPQDMQDLAAFYSAQTPKGGVADPAVLRAGERLYRGGNRTEGVSACTACHGPHGRGNNPGGIPALSGQHAVYTKAQLEAYASGARRSDAQQIMRNIAAAMSTDEMAAVASYVQGLR